jgi:hypothetical protein
MHGQVHGNKLVETDDSGAFQIDEIIPGPKFSLLRAESGEFSSR